MLNVIYINDWGEFEAAIRCNTQLHNVVARNFSKITFTNKCDEVDRLDIAIRTGSDRTEDSNLWNIENFDYDHDIDIENANKNPTDILYGSLMNLKQTPYLASMPNSNGSFIMTEFDLTNNLTEHDAIIIYDCNKLTRKSNNEYWFNTTAIDAALFIVTIDSLE